MANIEDLIVEAKQLEIYSEELDTDAKLTSVINFKKLQIEAEELGVDTKGIETQKDLKAAISEVKKLAKAVVKVEFLKSPTGICKLAYNIGDKAKIPGDQAKELIETGYAKKA